MAGAAIDDLKKRLGNKSEDGNKNLLKAEQKQISSFDYSEINEEDKAFLIKTENTLDSLGANFDNITIVIGKNLHAAQQKLASYSEGTFMKWYESMGLNKDNVSYFLKRYGLYLKHEDKEKYIANMPVTLVKALTHKDTPDELVDEVIEKEIQTTKEFNEIKKKYVEINEETKKKKLKPKLSEKDKDKILPGEIISSGQSEQSINKTENDQIQLLPFEQKKLIQEVLSKYLEETKASEAADEIIMVLSKRKGVK